MGSFKPVLLNTTASLPFLIPDAVFWMQTEDASDLQCKLLSQKERAIIVQLPTRHLLKKRSPPGNPCPERSCNDELSTPLLKNKAKEQNSTRNSLGAAAINWSDLSRAYYV
jgi:hypothetical protein